MNLDRNGQPLKVGDTVLIYAKIMSVGDDVALYAPGSSKCNVRFTTEEAFNGRCLVGIGRSEQLEIAFRREGNP